MDNAANMESKSLSTAQALLLLALLGVLFYWFIYRPEHIRQVCRIAYPDSAPSSGNLDLPSLPSLGPSYSGCLKSYGIKP